MDDFKLLDYLMESLELEEAKRRHPAGKSACCHENKCRKQNQFKSHIDDKGELVLTLEIPGVPSDDITLEANYEGITLTVKSGEGTEDKEPEVVREVHCDVDPRYDVSKAAAELDLCMLTITVPLSTQFEKRVLKIQDKK